VPSRSGLPSCTSPSILRRNDADRPSHSGSGRLSETEQWELDVADSSKPPTKGARTRATILRHAAESFRRDGYDDTTVASIAQKIGISEGTVFQHFGSKSGLLGAVMDEFYAELHATALDIAGSPGDAEQRFRNLIDAWALRAERDWDLIRVFTQRARYGTDPELDARWKEHNRRYTRLHFDLIEQLQAQGVLKDQVPPALIRDIVFGAIEHIALGQDLSPHMEIREKANQVVDVLVAHHAGQPPIDGRLERIERKLDAALGRGDGSVKVMPEGRTGDGSAAERA